MGQSTKKKPFSEIKYISLLVFPIIDNHHPFPRIPPWRPPHPLHSSLPSPPPIFPVPSHTPWNPRVLAYSPVKKNDSSPMVVLFSTTALNIISKWYILLYHTNASNATSTIAYNSSSTATVAFNIISRASTSSRGTTFHWAATFASTSTFIFDAKYR